MSSRSDTGDRRRPIAPAAAACVLLLAIAATPAAAGVNALAGFEGGPAWFFLNDDDADDARMDNQWSLGIFAVVISDFDWARNFAFEMHYFRSMGRGEIDFDDGRGTRIFDLTTDRMFFNFAYFFGGAIYDPFISGGVGTIRLLYENRFGVDKGRTETEWDVALNAGGGLDFKLHKHFSVGLRIQYVFVLNPYGFVDGHVSALVPSLRAAARF